MFKIIEETNRRYIEKIRNFQQCLERKDIGVLERYVRLLKPKNSIETFCALFSDSSDRILKYNLALKILEKKKNREY